jgi:hypothetical protein
MYGMQLLDARLELSKEWSEWLAGDTIKTVRVPIMKFVCASFVFHGLA